jgi:glycosyltransferase involved in cell wall biosynthesis
LDELSDADKRIKVIHFRKNFGQTAAIMAGIDASSGSIIITMDGDLQNDPKDIKNLLSKLNEGYDVCSGWRKDRKDNPLKRNLPSKLANWFISKVSGVHLNDYGCTLKAYKRHVIENVKLYGEMHRFIPIYAVWQGAKITEIPVQHHPRIHGKSKYGSERVIKVVLDLLVIKFLEKYAKSPIYIFGGSGVLMFLSSFFFFCLMIYYKIAGLKDFLQTPLPQLVTFLGLMGSMSILMGFIAEILMRTYYESQNKSIYLVKYKRNL